MGTAEVRKEVTISLSTIVLRVAELQEALSVSKEARCSLERRCESLQGQLDDARSDVESYRNKWNALFKQTKEKEGQLHGKIQQLQREGDAIKVHADTLAESLDRVLASREQALRCAKENCRAANYRLAVKTEECKRLQDQQNAFSALVSTLETELGTATASMSDARSMVTENRQAMKQQKAWIQGAMIREQQLIQKLDERVAALAAEHQQHSMTKEALSTEVATAAALLKAKNERDAKVDELLAERAALQQELDQQKEHHAKAQQHLRKSSELLQTATAAVQTHEAALESMKGKLATMHSSSAQRAAADAALLAEQEKELALLRTESAPLRGIHSDTFRAAPAHGMLANTAPAPPLQRPESAQDGKNVISGTGCQSQSRGESLPADAEEERATSNPGKSQAKASLDSQSQVDTSKDHKPAQGTAMEVSSRPHKPPAQHSSTGVAHVLRKRQSLQHPLLSPGSRLQPAADTPDELEVLSDIHSITREVEVPAKKPCLRPALCDNKDSHHSQALPGKDQLGSRDMGASEATPVQQHGMPLRSYREDLRPPGAAPASDGAPYMLTQDGEPDAIASDKRIAQAEGDKMDQQSARHSKADIFDAFAAFEGNG